MITHALLIIEAESLSSFACRAWESDLNTRPAVTLSGRLRISVVEDLETPRALATIDFIQADPEVTLRSMSAGPTEAGRVCEDAPTGTAGS